MQSIHIRAPDSVLLTGDAYGPDDAPPVVLLHGGGQTRHAWKGTARQIGAAGFRAVAMDLRGHGDSGRAPEGNYVIDQFVADLRATVAALGRPAAVVGASLGGVTGLLAAGELALRRLKQQRKEFGMRARLS